MQDLLKNTVAEINENKSSVSKILAPHITINTVIQKRKELIDLSKFIVASNESIEIISDQEKPDFIINWNEEKYGLEHSEVIDEEKKRQFEKNEWFIKQIEHHFINKYGNIERQINLSLKKDIIEIHERDKKEIIKNLAIEYKDLLLDSSALFSLIHPGYITLKDRDKRANDIADKIYHAYINQYEYFDDPLINYVSFYLSKKTTLHRNFGYSAGSLSEIILRSVEAKEKHLPCYLENTNYIKQCLFLVIQGSNGYSDYSYFDEKVLSKREIKFDKVIAFNFFTSEIYYLK